MKILMARFSGNQPLGTEINKLDKQTTEAN